MSVRWRLTLWYMGLLVFMLVGCGLVIGWQTAQVGLSSLDTTLARDAYRVAATLVRHPVLRLGGSAPDELALHTPVANLWVRLIDGHGHVVAYRGTPAPWVSAQPLMTARPGASSSAIWQPGASFTVRLYVLPVVENGKRLATIQMLADLRTLEDIRERLLRAAEFVALPTLLVALLGGLFLADRALRPVGRISRLAAQIGTSDLHQRVGSAYGRRRQARTDDELEQLASTFDAMLNRLEHAQTQQRQLIADAAHQLCTPVATMRANAEVTLSREREPVEYREALQHVLAETEQLGRLVDELLLLAHVEAGGLAVPLQPVELDDLCRTALRAVAPLATAGQIQLHESIPPWPVFVQGDDLALSQAVRNLLDNAIHHTPVGGTVSLVLEEMVGTVMTRVRDTGPGIPLAERELVFRRFHRTSGATLTGRRGGSGLGLAISRAIVEAHGGTIHADSAPGGGAELVIKLPANGSGGCQDGVPL